MYHLYIMAVGRTYMNILAIVLFHFTGVLPDCSDTRTSCHFCAVDDKNPRFFRYTDQYLKRTPICKVKPEYCTYDCEQVYHPGSGSVLDSNQCRCTYPDPAYTPPNTRGCGLFDVVPKDVLSGRIGVARVQTPAGLDIRGDQMCFNGTQSIIVPYFAENDLGFKLNLKLRFRTFEPLSKMADKAEMVLWTDGNCDNADDSQPGLVVAINRTGVIVRAAGPDGAVKTVYCQPSVSKDDLNSGVSNFLGPPLMNKVLVVYRAGKFSASGERQPGIMVVTVNDGVFRSTLSATCFALALGPSQLKASGCPLSIPGKSFHGCISKMSLERDCRVPSKEEDLLFKA